MTKSILHIIILALTILAAACGQQEFLDLNKNDKSSSNIGAPSGKDVISSSTNRSSKEDELGPKLNGISGASFVQAPQINNYGTVSLSYAIDVPGGRAGMQPGVGLSYSSSGGDGLVGIGWSMSTGLGVISRTTRHGQLYYDHRDTFTFNGKRLVKVEGSTDSEDGTYRLEIESGFSKFVLEDSVSGGVWKVYDKAGTITIFGENKSSRIYQPADDTKTYIWNFTRSYDLNGNYMYAVYDTSEYEENHILYLSEIRYTGNYNVPMDAKQYVKFVYRDRDDAYVSKAPGFIMKMDRLLDKIVVGWDSGELWDYKMVYETSEDSNRPLLKTVQSSRTTTEPEFIYQPANHMFAWQMVNNPDFNDAEINHEATKYFEGDFNGDGLSDMVFFNPETGYWKAAEKKPNGGYAFKIYGNKFKGYNNEAKIQWFKGNVSGDYNGDGRSDIAFYLPETREFWVAEHDGNVFQFKNYGRLYQTDIDIFKCEWFTGDYDGNGLSDAVLFNELTGEWILMTNEGGSFKFIKFSMKFKNLFRSDYQPNQNMDSEFTNDRSEYGKDRGKVHFLSGDYNGDGRTDISIYDSRDGKWWVAENERVQSLKFNVQSEDIKFELKWKLYKEFTAPEQTLFGHDRFSGDFNGDGFSDFLLFDRATGEWWLGATEDGTIRFSVFSKVPDNREVTRWLQGDFNGDGRTDIGFFSKTDNNFWIGEVTPTGFRYRIYNNLSYGPDTKVLEAPLPKDEVKLKDAKGVITRDGTSKVVSYKYNGNYRTDSGEKAFLGSFSGTGISPELLVFDRKEKEFFTVKPDGTKSDEILADELIDLDNKDIKILNNEKTDKYRGNNDGLLYYQKDTSVMGSSTHSFNLIYSDGEFNKQRIAVITDQVNDFNIDESFYLLDKFTDSDNKCLLVLDDKISEPSFKLFNEVNPNDFNTINFASGSELNKEYFKDIRNKRTGFRFFSGHFTVEDNEQTQILIVDMQDSSDHKWYLGEISGGQINFVKLDGNPSLKINGTPNSPVSHVRNNKLVYSTISDNRVKLYRATFTPGIGTPGSVNQKEYDSLETGTSFKNEFDHYGNPIVFKSDGTVQRITLGTSGFTLETITQETDNNIGFATIERSDLMTKVYKFRWIQGDYNGDGKTDIGIFHLKERTWYYAMTQGTVPDMINKVKNGIGGTYEMEYINSTTLDNTGDDDIPDLPMNYKVCNRLTVDDGRGNRIKTKYEYSGGYAFSAFINGYKETDYFGFGKFKVVDSYGSRTESTYNNVPYDDFRKNRALAGAIKETLFFGSDHEEYSRTTYEYKLHEISPPNPPEGGLKSFLVEPVKVQKYMKGTLVETRRSNIVLTDGKYEMVSKSESVTDHYDDEVHNPVTVTSKSEFENIEDTNEMRLLNKFDLNGTSHEIKTEYEYYTNGNLKTQTTSYTGSGLPAVSNRVTKYEYDGFGNRVKETDDSASPARIVRWEFDEPLKQYIVKSIVEGPIDLVTTYAINYGSAFGSADSKTDPNFNGTFYTYDDYGRLEKQEVDTDTGKETVADYSYNTGFPMSGKVTRYTGTSDPNIESRVFVDGMGRVIHSVSSALDVTGKRYVKSGMIIYDAIGRVISKSQTHWAGDDEINTYRANTTVKHPTITEYDPSGRVKKVTLPRGYSGEKETSITYTFNDPWEVIESHSVGRSKRTIKNARGQVLYVEDSGVGDDGETVTAKIGFAYDVKGNRVKKMDLNGITMNLSVDAYPNGSIPARDNSTHNIAYWWYDGLGQLVASNDPDLGYTGITYNAFGDVTNKTDGLDRTTTFQYDSIGRLTFKNLPDAEGNVTYTYDTLAGRDNTKGRVVSIEDSSQLKRFSYDKLGRIKHETRNIKQNSHARCAVVPYDYDTYFKYDLLNRKIQIDYPYDSNSEINAIAVYRYNSMGVVSITNIGSTPDKTIVSNINYNEFGQMTSITRGNSVTTNYSYDFKGRLTKLVTTTPSSGGGTLQDVSYEFKVDNSISSVVNNPQINTNGPFESTVSYNYTYDGLNRLIKANGEYDGYDSNNTFERGYGYAKNGNLISKTFYNPTTHAETDKWTYTYNNHAVKRIDSTKDGSNRFEMNYDSVGNMIYQEDNVKDKRKSIKYDSRNRMIIVSDPDTLTDVGEYFYDDQGFRVRKLARKMVDGNERKLEVLYPSMYFGIEKVMDLSDTELSSSSINNIYLNGIRIATIDSGGAARYYLTDQVDSVKVVVDDAGDAVKRFEYLPYGEEWFSEGDLDHAPKYNSQELDEETNFYYYNARHYDPEIGRFVTADNVIDGEYDTQGWNRFAYVKGNPIVYKDPTGHNTESRGGFVLGLLNSLSNKVANLFSSGNEKVSSAVEQEKNKIKSTVERKINNVVDPVNKTIKKLAKLGPIKFVENFSGRNFHEYARDLHQTSEKGRKMKIEGNYDSKKEHITGINWNEAKKTNIKEVLAGIFLGEKQPWMKKLDKELLHSTAVVHDNYVIDKKIDKEDPRFTESMVESFFVAKIVETYNRIYDDMNKKKKIKMKKSEKNDFNNIHDRNNVY
ncbi:SpvB/TcaC N-terminal domain-containing protein [Spirochaetota bacterium]